MPQAKLTVEVPEAVWVGQITRAHPEARVRVLAALPDDAGDDAGVGLAEVAADDVPDVLAAIDQHPSIRSVETMRVHEDEALIQFETTDATLLYVVQESGIPLEMPFDIRAGRAEWEITAPRDRLSALADRLELFGVDYTVEYVQQRVDSQQLLTDRQLRLVRAAVERGYYDTPRTCTLTELAEATGIAKSTCSETLHRAEGAVMKSFLEDAERPDPTPDP